jgi:hypothetical protein
VCLKKTQNYAHREGAGQDQLVLIKRRKETGWENMTLSQKAVDFTARHQFSAIAGCWTLGIAGAFGAIMRDPCVDLIAGESGPIYSFPTGIRACHKRYGVIDPDAKSGAK